MLEGIALVVDEIVGADAQRLSPGIVLDPLLHVASDARRARRDEKERDHTTARPLVQLAQGAQEQVVAFVVDLVATGRDGEERIFDFFSRQGLRDASQPGADLVVGHVTGQVVDPSEVQAVGQQRVGLATVEQRGLLRGDAADRREDIRLARRDALERVLAADPLIGRRLFRRALPERHGRLLSGRRQRTPQHRGVGREHGSDRRRVLLEVEEARGRQPLVELCDCRLSLRGDDLAPPLVDGDAGRVREEHRLDVFPPAHEGVHPMVFPQVSEDRVLLLEQAGESDE